MTTKTPPLFIFDEIALVLLCVLCALCGEGSGLALALDLGPACAIIGPFHRLLAPANTAKPSAAVAMNDITRILSAIDAGDPQASERLLPLVYEELRQLAAHKLAQEAPG